MDGETKQTALLFVAGGIGICFVLWGVSLALPAAGVAAGLAWSIGSTGTAVGISVAPFLVQLAAYGLAGAGVGSATFVIVKVARRVQQEPFQWLLPILGVVNGFLVQVCSDYWSGPKLVWLALSTISALLVVVSGALYVQESVTAKVAGFILHLLIPVVVVLSVISDSPESLRLALEEVPYRVWLLITAMALSAVVVATLARTLSKRGD